MEVGDDGMEVGEPRRGSVVRKCCDVLRVARWSFVGEVRTVLEVICLRSMGGGGDADAVAGNILVSLPALEFKNKNTYDEEHLETNLWP